MTSRRLLWVAWGMSAAAGLALVVLTALYLLDRHSASQHLSDDLPNLVGTVTSILVGVRIVSRYPRHGLGWLLVVLGFANALSGLSMQWAVLGLDSHPGSVPGARAAIWISFWLAVPTFALFPTLGLLLFPSGTLQGRATRVVAGVSMVAATVLMLGLVLGGFFPPDYDPLLNDARPLFGPFRIANAFDPAFAIPLLAICALASIAVVIGRFRRARAAERQQLKWVVYAMAVVVAAFVADFAARLPDSRIVVVTGPAISFAFALVPVTMGVAILRYHLYEIDRLISRTLVYGSLTVGLATFYLSSVLVLQQALDPVTSGSDLAVASTTLLVAALARPLRNRLQRLVDRRFYRRHYDAAAEIARFAARLREQTDLDTLSEEIREVVYETMQPRHVSLWIPERAHAVGHQ